MLRIEGPRRKHRIKDQISMFGFSLHFSRWGAAMTLFISIASVVFALPNVIPLSTYESLPSWAQLPRMPLGLDLGRQAREHHDFEISTN